MYYHHPCLVLIDVSHSSQIYCVLDSECYEERLSYPLFHVEAIAGHGQLPSGESTSVSVLVTA
jgi:hypothetical protein